MHGRLIHMPRKTRVLSDSSAAVLALFLQEPERERFGLEIIGETGIPSGSLYPILHRFEERGLLDATWEDLSAAVLHGRRPRKRYRLSSEKTQSARDQLAAWQTNRPSTTPRRLRARTA